MQQACRSPGSTSPADPDIHARALTLVVAWRRGTGVPARDIVVVWRPHSYIDSLFPDGCRLSSQSECYAVMASGYMIFVLAYIASYIYARHRLNWWHMFAMEQIARSLYTLWRLSDSWRYAGWTFGVMQKPERNKAASLRSGFIVFKKVCS